MNQTNNTPTDAVIVLGVYGSGSSAVAGILHHLGVMMGEKLIPATPANPKGHFEDAEFRRMLYQLRNDPTKLAEINAFINGRFATYPLWGVKEPAILEAISDIAPMLQGRKCKIIATQRDVNACLRSYQRKHPDCDAIGTRQQIQYLIQQREKFIQNWSPEVLWINFNDLTDQPEQHVESILKFVFGDAPSVFENRPWPSAAAIQAAVDSVDPDMNHRLERLVSQSHHAARIPYHEDPVLQKWVKPHYLRPDTIASIKEASKAKPFCKYAVLDAFFNEAVLDAYLEQHQALEFMADDEGLPYDSNWTVPPEGSLGAELFYYEPWHRLLAEYTDTELVVGHAATSVKLRKHDPDSKGFWIHTDRTKRKSTVALAALIYLNKNWQETDGALLQLWVDLERDTPIADDEIEYRWKEYKEQRLDFLNERYSLTTDLVTYTGPRPAEVFLIDQILPEYNRLVITDFIRDPAYHSITPSNGRTRYGIVQWLM